MVSSHSLHQELCQDLQDLWLTWLMAFGRTPNYFFIFIILFWNSFTQIGWNHILFLTCQGFLWSGSDATTCITYGYYNLLGHITCTSCYCYDLRSQTGQWAFLLRISWLCCKSVGFTGCGVFVFVISCNIFALSICSTDVICILFHS